MRRLFTLFLYLCIIGTGYSAYAQNAFLESRYSYFSYEDEVSLVLHDPMDFSLSNTELRIDGLKHYFSIRRLTPKVSLLSISSKHLDQGAHQVELVVKDQAVLSCRFSILPVKKNEVKVDRLSGGLMVNERPFYPLGFYTRLPMDEVIKREVYHGFNMVGPYQRIDAGDFSKRKAYMDLCNQLGLKVNYAVNSLINKKGLTPSEQAVNFKLLEEEVIRMKDHPALLCWYLNDEPVGQGRDPKYIQKAYDLIKQLDPYHPISIVFMTPERASEFEGGMDIAMTDPYPIPGPIDAVPNSVNCLMNQFEYRKGVWYVPQTFGGGEFWQREPTEREIRAMCYSAIQQGAMGLQAFIKKGVNEFPKSITSWNGYVKVVNEVGMLMPWLNSKAMRQELTTDDPNILASYWRRDESGLLVVVNKSNKPMPFNVALPSGCRDEQVEVLFENRMLPFDNAYVKDMIDGLGVRVYKIYQPKKANDNILAFGDFEEFSSASTPESCYAQNSSFDGSRYFLDATSYYEGNYSLCFLNNGENSEMGLSFYRTLVSPNQGYRLAFYAKAEGSSQDTLFVELKGLGLKMPYVLTPKWTKYTLDFHTDASTAQISIGLISKGKGRYWLDNMGMYYDPNIQVKSLEDNSSLVVIKKYSQGSIYYKTTSLGKSSRWKKYRLPFKVDQTTEIDAVVKEQGREINRSSKVVLQHIGMNAKMQLTVPASIKYPGLLGDQSLLDGKDATTSYFDKNWQGYEGTDLRGDIDLQSIEPIHRLRFSFLDDVKNGIHLPKRVKVWVSKDGNNYRLLSEVDVTRETNTESSPKHVPIDCLMNTDAQFIRYEVVTQHVVPDGFLFKGTKAWTFIDEIEVY
ncbi:hypothetical protein K5X82_10650 [Halosquirtibacter xylanolyticus]|uniref:glycoside hydrolase family 2 TIM barrel-domain containing protein n=1 Tax=Halosquirtibacter xylanolyticus TaxID=3374599 RepID=UPI003748B4BA|nr:hypothetical protein K5X82_10650 [Prolixibacteraceae bacterium]